MTSKSLFFKLMKEDIKRRLWAVALITLAFFFSLPVVAAFMTGEIQDISAMVDMEKYMLRLTADIQNLLSINNGFISFLLVITAIICGCSSFSYLNSKKQVDFYHSIPVKRETLYFANFITGILIVVIPYLLNVLAAILISVLNGVALSAILGNALLAFLFQMVHYLMIYATVVIAVMMTGKLLVGILGTGIFFFYVPCMMFVISGCFGTWFRSYYFDGIKGIEYSSPLAFYIWNIYQWTTTGTGFLLVQFLLIPLLIGLVLSGLGLVLYRLRPSESAGTAMAFHKSKSIIRILIVFASGLTGSLIFWQFRSSMGWGLFGLICGCVISHCVIEIIYNSDFKKLFSHKLQLLGTGLISLVLFLSFRYDWFGYDSFLPKANEVETASISFLYVDDWVTYGKPYQQENGVYSWQNQSKDDYIFSHMRLSNVEDVLEIAQAGILRNRELDDGNERMVYNSDDIDNQYYTTISIEYQMKNGKKTRRSYYFPLSRVMESAVRVYDSFEYKKGNFPLLQMTSDELSYIEFEEYKNTAQVVQNKETLLEAYQEELAGLTMETMKQECPIATIRFVSKEMDQAITASETMNSRNFSHYEYYPVYPSFTKTLGLLENQGIHIQEILPDSIVEMRISDERSFYKDGEYVTGETVWITDVSEQKEVLAASVPVGYMNYNYWLWRSNNDDIRVEMSVESENKTTEYRMQFIDDKIPDWVKERIHYDERKKLWEETNQ